MQYVLRVFKTEDEKKFRTIEIDGEPWFALQDVCRSLGLQSKKNSYYHHAERLDPDEKQSVSRDAVREANSPLEGEVRSGGKLIVINESGLFSLILRSDRPEAKRLKKWVTSEVLPSIRRTGAYDPRRGTPAFIKRFNANWDRVTPGYFSVINEVAVRLHGRLEQVGHILADTAPDGKEIQPDGSIGSLFSKHLRTDHPTVADNYSLYWHVARMKEVQARQYPYGMLPIFLNFVDGVWIPEHSERYLRTRDPAALPYLPFLLPPPPQAAAMRGLPVPAWAKPQPARLPRPR